MTLIDLFEAKSNLSKLLQMLESGEEDIFVIARDGTPVADLTLTGRRDRVPSFLGFKDGAYNIPDDIDSDNDEIANLFGA